MRGMMTLSLGGYTVIFAVTFLMLVSFGRNVLFNFCSIWNKNSKNFRWPSFLEFLFIAKSKGWEIIPRGRRLIAASLSSCQRFALSCLPQKMPYGLKSAPELLMCFSSFLRRNDVSFRNFMEQFLRREFDEIYIIFSNRFSWHSKVSIYWT